MDEEGQFVANYETTHGPGSWAGFMRDWEASIQGRDVQLMSYMPEVSGWDGNIQASGE